MSRREFRADVVMARPASAWVMAGVAGTTLWITGQLSLWATGLQALAIVLSLLRREEPWPWMKNAVWLNALMFAVVGVTIQVAFRSASSVIALAHFAALAQGVQLLDARPRRSEFLLVALALFQVVLAANLTDSLLFLPLLGLFVFATTWTLIVHTLRSEAAEAGDANAAHHALTSGLLRTTLVAASVAILLAAMLFVLLPRMRTSIVNASLGGSNAVSGFSDRVELGSIGRIRQDSSVVLRVETLEGSPPALENGYWRALAFDHFDGREWAITPNQHEPQAGSPKLGIDLARTPRRDVLVQRIVREPVEAGVLFTAGQAHHVTGALHSIERDVNGGLYDPAQFDARVRYTVSTHQPARDDAALRKDRSSAPRAGDERYAHLPDFDRDVAGLATRITQGANSDADRALALETHLRTHGRYTDSPEIAGAGSARSPIESFLLEERAGHCEYFASGMVVLARSLGLHARLVNGFAGGRVNPLGGFTELLRSDAHAWVEVHYEEAGWVRYDPTPPDLRLRAAASASLAERLSELRSAVELWWFQRVVDFDSSDQIAALKAVVSTYRRTKSVTDNGPARAQRALGLDVLRELPWRDFALAALVLGFAALVWRGRRRETQRPLDREYASALRMLKKRGLVRGASTPARPFARQASAALPAAAGTLFTAITESYLASRFGGRPHVDSPERLAALRRALGRSQSAP